MFTKHSTDVFVAGAGPVGLMAALRLTGAGLGVQIIDEEWRPAAHSYALALHSQSMELLDHLGMADELLAEGIRVQRVALYDGASRIGELHLSALPGRFPYLLVLSQDRLEALLEARLRQNGVRVQWNHRLSDLEPAGQSVLATIDQLDKVSSGYSVATTEWVIEKRQSTMASFIIGADGHRSLVRKRLEIPYDVVGVPEFYAVFEFQSEPEPDPEVRIVMDDRFANVLWPLPGGRYRWSFQLSPHDFPDASRRKSRLAVQIGEQSYEGLTRDDLHALILSRAPWFQAPIGELRWAMAIRFERRLAASFGRERCWLAGDAAHLTGPVGAQSMNVGFREADDLARRISTILKDGAPMDLLREYERSRTAEWRQLLGLAGGLMRGPRTDPWAALHRARLLPCLPASGEDLAILARQLGLEATVPAAAGPVSAGASVTP
jgi:2-polyprenyl-6-methoxyphenol hydroxylase-like FAD-dependent oxidoreductase